MTFLGNERPLSAKEWKMFYPIISDAIDAKPQMTPLIIIVGEEGTKNIPMDIFQHCHCIDNREKKQ